MVPDLTDIAEALPVRLYTLPPRDVQWSFLLVHTDNYTELYRRRFRHAIIDIQVHRFRKYGDYPADFIRWYCRLCLRLAQHFRDKLCVVAPDLPWDPSYFHGAQYSDNIRKTYRYHAIFRALEPKLRQHGTQVMYVLQHRQTIKSLRQSANILVDVIHGEPEYVGVGSLCVDRSPKRVALFIREARRLFPRAWIHGFGVHLRVLKYCELHSFDSDSWTRPVNETVLRVIKATKRFSCKTEQQRKVYFLCYVARLCELLNRHDLASQVYRMLGVQHEYGTLLAHIIAERNADTISRLVSRKNREAQ